MVVPFPQTHHCSPDHAPLPPSVPAILARFKHLPSEPVSQGVRGQGMGGQGNQGVRGQGVGGQGVRGSGGGVGGQPLGHGSALGVSPSQSHVGASVIAMSCICNKYGFYT